MTIAKQTINLTTLTAASAGASLADIRSDGHRGLHLVVDITAISGSGATLTVTIEGKDEVSGKYYPILASAALNATGTTVLRVYPGFTASANVTANDVLPLFWRVQHAIAGSSPSVTGKIGGSLLA